MIKKMENQNCKDGYICKINRCQALTDIQLTDKRRLILRFFIDKVAPFVQFMPLLFHLLGGRRYSYCRLVQAFA